MNLGFLVVSKLVITEIGRIERQTHLKSCMNVRNVRILRERGGKVNVLNLNGLASLRGIRREVESHRGNVGFVDNRRDSRWIALPCRADLSQISAFQNNELLVIQVNVNQSNEVRRQTV